MTFAHVSYIGPPIDDPGLLGELPAELAGVLGQANGRIAAGGAFHLRGACAAPAWHALRAAWWGPQSVAARYPSVRPADVPFGQDVLGDQYLWREGEVWRLSAECDEVTAVAPSLEAFLAGVAGAPVEFLGLGPMAAFWAEGGRLEPGQLLSVYPPLVFRPVAGGVSYRAVSVADRLGALASLALQLRELPDGTPVAIVVGESAS